MLNVAPYIRWQRGLDWTRLNQNFASEGRDQIEVLNRPVTLRLVKLIDFPGTQEALLILTERADIAQ